MGFFAWTCDRQPVRAYVARPSTPGPAVVVLHSAWGLLHDYVDVCRRLAAEGFLAVAPDLFDGRTALSWGEAEQFALERPSTRLVPASVAAVQWLRAQPDVVPNRVALLGFSLGGATALRAAAGGVGDVVVTFYGTPAIEKVDGLRVPVLGHFAETDRYEPASDVSALFEKLQRQGTPVSVMTYPGTGHCFFEPSIPTYDKRSAEKAWNTTLAFLRQHLNLNAQPRS